MRQPSIFLLSKLYCRNGAIDYERLREMVVAVGRERLVLDLSCRKRRRPADDAAAAPAYEYVVVTDRWQKWTDFVVGPDSLRELSQYCDEFLVHGVDVEGLRAGEGSLIICEPLKASDSTSSAMHFVSSFTTRSLTILHSSAGIEDPLVELLGAHSLIPVTYAGGVRDMADVERVRVSARQPN